MNLEKQRSVKLREVLHAILNTLYFILRVMKIFKRVVESNVVVEAQGITANVFDSESFFFPLMFEFCSCNSSLKCRNHMVDLLS